MQAVPDADVIIRNPTHFAVALKYDIHKNNAPILVAKGQDLIALKIVEIAEKNSVTVIENRPLARESMRRRRWTVKYRRNIMELWQRFWYRFSERIKKSGVKMKKLLNNAVAVIVVMIVLLLIIPLNPFCIGCFIILNISISLIILLISMNIKRAAGVFDFSIHAFDHDVVPYRDQYLFHKKYPWKLRNGGSCDQGDGRFCITGKRCSWFHYLYHYRIGAVPCYHKRCGTSCGGCSTFYIGCDAGKTDGDRRRLKYRSDRRAAGQGAAV